MMERFYAFVRVNVVYVALLAIVMVIGSMLFVQTAQAEGEVTNSVNTLKVSPVRSDITIKPGESKEVAVVVTNLTSSAVKIKPSTNDFTTGDEYGTPALILDEAQYAKSHSLKRFMGEVAETTIAPKQAGQVKVKISVPADAKAGGYFGAIRFSSVSPDGGQVNLSPSVASLILLTVSGEFTEKLQLTTFQIQQSGVAGTVFRDDANIEALFRFKSEGNVQVGPFGQVAVKKGDNLIYTADLNNKDPRDMVLPDGVRRWEVPVSKLSGFGKYTVSATLTYGTKNQTIQDERTFWIIPVSVIIAAVAGLVLLVALLIALWVFLKKRSSRGKRVATTRRRG